MTEQAKFEVVRLDSATPSTRLHQFVEMMDRMYAFHATLHSDWQTKPGWQKGSENWIKRAGNNEEYFFGLAYPFGVESEAAGYVIASFHYEAPLFIQNRFGYIADLWVEEAYRKNGVGRQLLNAAYSWFKEQGVSRVQLEVDVENIGGQKFWRGIGYSDFEIVMRTDI